MCLLLVETSKAVSPLLQEDFDNARDANPHGFGIAWVNKSGRVVSSKFTRGDPYKSYLHARKVQREGTPIVMHWRWATHGDKVAELCHPFAICKGSVSLFHNGILPEPTNGRRESDTSVFARRYRLSTPEWVFSDQWAEGTTTFIGSWNKIALLGPNGTLRILNENAGEWDEGRWHSNDAMLRPQRRIRWKREDTCQSNVSKPVIWRGIHTLEDHANAYSNEFITCKSCGGVLYGGECPI